METSTPLASSPLYWAMHGPIMLALRGAMKTLAPRWRVSGRENIPARGGVLFAPNHISDCDPVLVGLSLRRPAWFMAKEELFDIKVLGPLMTFAQAFPVERGGADRAALKRGEGLLKNRQALVVFPEGRLSENGELQPLLPGITMLALRAGVPIIPVGIAGSTSIVPFGELAPRRTLEPVHLHFGTPLQLSDLKELPSRAAREQSTQRLEAALRSAINIARSA